MHYNLHSIHQYNLSPAPPAPAPADNVTSDHVDAATGTVFVSLAEGLLWAAFLSEALCCQHYVVCIQSLNVLTAHVGGKEKEDEKEQEEEEAGDKFSIKVFTH